MEKAIIGKKVGMTQIFDEAGRVIPVTVIEAGPCTVVQKKTAEKDGYEAVQLGYEDVAEKKLTKPELGHLKKAGVSAKRVLKEFALNNAESLNIGDEVKVRVSGIDSQGRVNLVRADMVIEEKPRAPRHDRGERRDRGDRGEGPKPNYPFRSNGNRRREHSEE